MASLTLGRWYASLESVCVILKGKGRVEGVAAQRLRARCLPHGWQCNLYPPVAVIVVVVIIAEKAIGVENTLGLLLLLLLLLLCL